VAARGSHDVVRLEVPNAKLLITPHSPLACGFFRSQSGMKLPLPITPVAGLTTPTASTHGRLVFVAIAFDGDSVVNQPPPRPIRCPPEEAFSAVLPFATTSYATPTRGVRSS